MSASPGSSLNVLVAGGGVAGLETLMALRDLAGDRVRLTLLTPEDDFVYRPMAVGQPFARGRARRIGLEEICAPLSVEIRRGTLDRVELEGHAVVTDSRARLNYDALVVATGARSAPAIQRAQTWTPEADAEVFGGLLRDLEEGYTKRVAFVVPPGVAWPLPGYELALMTAWDARGMNRDDVEVVVHTHEPSPLAVFGEVASAGLRADLEQAGVTVQTGVTVDDAGGLGAQRVVALPVAVPNTP